MIEQRESIVVIKNGRAVARSMPMSLQDQDPFFGFYRGKLEIVGDIVSPVSTDEELDRFFEQSVAQLHDPA